MYEDLDFGAFHGAEQDTVTERAEQTPIYLVDAAADRHRAAESGSEGEPVDPATEWPPDLRRSQVLRC